jgi:hypothetical protein
MTLQAVSKYGAGKAQIAENQKTVIDWEHWEAAIDDPVVGELKGVYEQLLKEAEAKIVPAYEKDQQDVLAKLNEQFEGLVRPASPSDPLPHHRPPARFSPCSRPSTSALATRAADL